MTLPPKTLLLIGGTDPSGAGLSADIAVAQNLVCPISPVVTAVTAQRHDALLDRGVLCAQRIKAQLACIDFAQVAYAKIGMLGNADVVIAVAQSLPDHVQIIIDPVLSSSSGGVLLDDDGVRAMIDLLLPRAYLITPNIGELSQLTGQVIDGEQALMAAAEHLIAMGAKSALVKGGHFQTNKKQCLDYFFVANHAEEEITDNVIKKHFFLSAKRWQDRQNVRGTGCLLATAIACFLHKADSHPGVLIEAVVMAKAAVNMAVANAVKDGSAYRARFTGLPQQHQYLPALHLKSGFNQQLIEFTSCDVNRLGIYPVVESVDWIKKLVPLGIKTIQLRIKDQDEAYCSAQIKAAVEYCTPRNIRLFINDHWQLAIAYGAYGVHLGQEDVETADLSAIAKAGLRLGLSSHCWAEVSRAWAIKPSYLALGPVFATTSKQMPWQPQGVEAVRDWVRLFDGNLPLVAIGGIDYARAAQLKETGVGSVAMISEIMQAEDFQQATQDLLALWG